MVNPSLTLYWSWISAGVDPDWVTHAKETALLLAARQGQHDALVSLINFRADLDLSTNEGYTPLWEG